MHIEMYVLACLALKGKSSVFIDTFSFYLTTLNFYDVSTYTDAATPLQFKCPDCFIQAFLMMSLQSFADQWL
jgi:hypothetical protein